MNTDELHDFDYIAFLIGTAIFVCLPILGYYRNMDWIIPFSAIGPLYIGYKSKNYKQGFVVGGISGIFLSLAVIYGYLGPYTTPIFDIYTMNVLVIVICFIMGGFIADVGTLFKSNREKALEMAESEKKGSKNIKIKKRPIEPGINRLKKRFGKK
ncbi:hypothetical protein BGI41_06820 [Methanobrevibacter sp. 87.7]|uniref:hypothetical protein n=1 Tax=Methanobrevibacter sp. 87.7 TaxID=387957 RepID=UPI000B502D95|nr:hypothetical protein [Methanobrevibacter sp. 87.7]OWT32601.1 hypothetical protein BGI41_06820 [Methanobrevibacter sp. 87.7]